MIGHSRSMNIESEPIHQIIWMIFSLEAVGGALSQLFLEDINVYHPTPILEDLQCHASASCKRGYTQAVLPIFKA